MQKIKVNKINTFKDPVINLDYQLFTSLDLKKNKAIKKILIIKWGGMGDVIQSSVIVNDILETFSKNCKVDLNVLPKWQELFKEDNRLNNIWGFNFDKGFQKFHKIIKWLKYVRSEKYDLIIDLQTNDRSRIMLGILKIFFSYPSYSVGNHPVWPYSLKPKSNIAVNQQFIRLQRTISTIGISPSSRSPKIISSGKKEVINKLLNINNLKNKKFFIFIPGSSKTNLLKRWGTKNFYNLSKLINNLGYKIILIGGPDDIVECDKLKKMNNNLINLCNQIQLNDLIFLFKKAKYIIANDTGPTHLSACTNTPVIQITGPTNPFFVKPFGSNIISVQSDISCKNCYLKKCDHHSCMHGITPAFLFNIFSKKI